MSLYKYWIICTMKATSLISSQLFISLPACPHILTPADVLAQEGEHVAFNFLHLASSCCRQFSSSRRRRSSGPKQVWKVAGRWPLPLGQYLVWGCQVGSSKIFCLSLLYTGRHLLLVLSWSWWAGMGRDTPILTLSGTNVPGERLSERCLSTEHQVCLTAFCF